MPKVPIYTQGKVGSDRAQVGRISRYEPRKKKKTMAGTVLITGANGSLGLDFVEALLKFHPQYTLVATVRNPTPETDANTAKLHAIATRYPSSRVLIEPLDLGSLSAVRTFAQDISARIANHALPRLSAIVCNAFSWSLRGMQTTTDGYEATFQISHLSHFVLILKLLGSVDTSSGRIVLLGSTAHYPEHDNPLCKLRPGLPPQDNDMGNLIRPPPDDDNDPAQVHDKGFQRYATAKLANVMLTNDLNERLVADPKLKNITATCMDPGGLVGSRAHVEQKAVVRTMLAGVNMLMPLLRHVTSAVRTTADAGRDLATVSVASEFQGKRGYYVGLKENSPAQTSLDPKERKRLWDACWKWAAISEGETVLKSLP